MLIRGARRRMPDGDDRASVVELFFDLVFVLVVTRLSALLLEHLSVAGAAETLFLLLVAWWAWMYTTWMTNWFDPDSTPVRVVLLVCMFASMLGAIAISDAFGERGLLLVAGYVVIQTFRNAFAVLATDPADPLHRPLQRILAWSAWVAVIWLAGAFAEDEARVAIWLLALICDYAGPYAGHWTPGLGRSRPEDWALQPSHFVERIELFLIIALGESIVAAGRTASELPVTGDRLLAVAVAFGMTVAFWWLYFGFHAERALKRLEDAEVDRGRVGRELSYLHVILVAGIIVDAVSDELVIAHPDERLSGAELLVVGGGPILYLLGSMALKARVLKVAWGRRGVASVLVALAALLGTQMPALATKALVLAVLAGLAAVEAFERRPATPRMAQARRRAVIPSD